MMMRLFSVSHAILYVSIVLLLQITHALYVILLKASLISLMDLYVIAIPLVTIMTLLICPAENATPSVYHAHITPTIAALLAKILRE